MRKITHLTAAIGLAIAPVLLAAPAEAATLNHTWVASSGTDNVTCGDRSAPCATFAGAFGRTTAGGEITCVDSGNYAATPLFIDMSITINCENAIGSVSSSAGPTYIRVTTAITDIVTLRGLDLDAMDQVFPPNNGRIIFDGAGVLHVHKVKINNARGVPNSGILFTPSGGGKLFVSDSTITDHVGSSGVSGGIVIKPAASATAEVSIIRTQIENNFYGIFADGTGGGTIRGVVRDSVVSGNVNIGITVAASSTSVVLLVDNTTVANNNYGMAAVGTGAGLAVGRSSIIFNNTGLFTATGGVLGSYKNNNVGGNTVDGMFNAFAGLQ